MYHSHYLEIFNRKQITIFHLMMPSFRVVIEYSMKGKRGQYLYTFELRFTIAAYIMETSILHTVFLLWVKPVHCLHL